MPTVAQSKKTPQERTERARVAARARTTPTSHVAALVRIAPTPPDLDAWADQVAASLPPLDQAAAVVVGRLAAALDRRAQSGGAPDAA